MGLIKKAKDSLGGKFNSVFENVFNRVLNAAYDVFCDYGGEPFSNDEFKVKVFEYMNIEEVDA